MAEDARDDLLLEILRPIQDDIAGLKHDSRELKIGQARIERELHALRGDLLRQAEALAAIDIRVERIENRLDLH